MGAFSRSGGGKKWRGEEKDSSASSPVFPLPFFWRCCFAVCVPPLLLPILHSLFFFCFSSGKSVGRREITRCRNDQNTALDSSPFQKKMSEKNSIPLHLHKVSLELLKWWGIPVRSREGRKRDKSRGGEGREGAKICRFLPSRVVRAKEERGKLSPTHKHTAAKTPLRLREEEERGAFLFPRI